MPAVIKTCKCPNKFQDRKYGKNRRVQNTTAKGTRCTSCGTENNN